ncbi:unnamed protein product, partial [Mesorhabditis spiculigera]
MSGKTAGGAKAPPVAVGEMPTVGKFVNSVEGNVVYEVTREIGSGTFGSVYQVQRKSDGKKMAMKCEHVSVKKQVLPLECHVLDQGNAIKSPHFCMIFDKGQCERFCFITMTLLGPNLWHLRKVRPHRTFSINTGLKVAEQALQGIRDLHRIGYLHRDIKPLNFAIGDDADSHTVFIIDFGMGRQFKGAGKEIRKPRASAPFRGTTRYAALAVHHSEEQSRRDDIESWLYMMIELITGSLPWKQFPATERAKIMASKEDSRDKLLPQLLEGCPFEAFSRILGYLDQLSYKDIPDYDFVWKMIDVAAKQNGCSPADALDWDLGVPYRGPRYVPERTFN